MPPFAVRLHRKSKTNVQRERRAIKAADTYWQGMDDKPYFILEARL